ncbi:hypothetical protein B0A52_00849 [Exophiala mesophila]|uniref:HAD hydrolase, family IA n=1 Tax=Exophiala mesophila TaxID=212818 RepID=A0A438NIE4_EXOME|nr:hypothetical protein B0A52_00849 [Exophiala mesophila]
MQIKRSFAPLNPKAASGHDRPKLEGIIFDVDGTLCLPQNYMFKEMRAALGIPRSVDILDHIRSLSNEPDVDRLASEEAATERPHAPGNTSSPPSEATLAHSISEPSPPPTSAQARAAAKIQAIERTAMTQQRPQPGLNELMSYLGQRGVPKALCTRNFPAPVQHLLDKFLQGEVFEPVVTRETKGIRPKPSPDGLWMIAQAWGLDNDVDSTERNGPVADDGVDNEVGDVLELAKRRLGSGLIMVGDSIDDMSAGRRAGAATVLLVNDENEHLLTHDHTDLGIRRLDELIDILDQGFEARR